MPYAFKETSMILPRNVAAISTNFFIISLLQDIYRNSLVSEDRMKIKYTPEYAEVLLKYFQLIWVAVCTKMFTRKRRILWLNLI